MPPAAPRTSIHSPSSGRGLLKDTQCCGAIVEDGGGVEEVDVAGNWGTVCEVDRRQFRVAAGATRAARVRHHRPAQPTGIDPGTEGDNRSAHAIARHIGRPDREVLGPPARTNHGVDEQHVTGRRRYQDLSGPWDGVWQVTQLEDIGATETSHLDGAHVRPPRCRDRLASHLGPRNPGGRDRR